MQTKLYVGNVPWSTTEAELFDLFTAYGAVKSAKIILDRETQRSRGFAFVEFMDEPSAQDAVDQENDREFNGRRLKVNFATERDRNAPRDDRPREPRNDARPPSNTNNNNNKDGQRRSRPNKRRDDYAE